MAELYCPEKVSSLSRVISRNNVTVLQRWKLPEVSIDVPVGETTGPTFLEGLEIVRQQAHEEAYVRGYAEGRQAAREEGYAQGFEEGRQAAMAKFEMDNTLLKSLLNNLTQPLAELDERIEQELLELAIATARQVIRRETKLDPGQIMAVIREAKSVLPASTQNITILLHPEDADFIRQVLHPEDDLAAWRIQEDPGVTRGGAKIIGNASYVDATIENRVARIAASLLGGDRAGDRAQREHN